MGVITDLLAANDSKKREDTRMQLTSAATMAALPGISDEDREYYQKAFHAAAGRALGIPEKHHGTLGSILSSLGNLNPYPKKQPLAGVGPEPEDPILSPEALDAQTAMKEGIARKSRMADTYAQQGALNDIAEDKVARERDLKLNALNASFANGEISKEQYATSKLQLYNFKPSTAAPPGTWSLKRVVAADGTSLGDWSYNNKSRMWANPNGEQSETLPPGAHIEAKPLSRQLDELTQEYMAASNLPFADARQKAGQTLLERGWSAEQLRQIGYQQKSQGIGIQGELSGGVTGSKAPPMPTTAPTVPATGAPGGQGATIPPPIGSRVATARAAHTGAQAASAAVGADPQDFTSRYNTPIPPERQQEFNKWVVDQTRKTGRSPLADRYDYDVQGDFLAGASRDERGHGSDQFKKPNHPTFSSESRYNGTDGFQGGQWVKDAQGNYVAYQPSDTNFKFRSPEQLQQYMQKVEPGIKLVGAPTAASGPAPVSARVRAARGATGTPAGVTPVVQPVAGQGAAPTAPGVLTPAQFERMKATDPTVQQAYQYLTGLTAVRASSGAAGLGLKKGIQKIVQATGLNETQLKSELVARKGAAEALDTAQKRLGAYGSVEKTIQGMGEVLQEAYRRHPQSDWKFWNAVKIAQSDKISGDPEIDAVRTAIEGYKTAYGKFMTGGAMSNAQIPVASQSRTHEVINNTMSGKEITAILKQVRDEADNEHKKLVENAAELSQQIAAPIGQWNTDPSASAGDVAVKALPANATPLQKFLAKHGGQ